MSDHLPRVLLGFQPREGVFVVQIEGEAGPLLKTPDPSAAVSAVGLSSISCRTAPHASRRALRALKSCGVDV